jgi:hypothetical protein
VLRELWLACVVGREQNVTGGTSVSTIELDDIIGRAREALDREQ